MILIHSEGPLITIVRIEIRSFFANRFRLMDSRCVDKRVLAYMYQNGFNNKGPKLGLRGIPVLNNLTQRRSSYKIYLIDQYCSCTRVVPPARNYSDSVIICIFKTLFEYSCHNEAEFAVYV